MKKRKCGDTVWFRAFGANGLSSPTSGVIEKIVETKIEYLSEPSYFSRLYYVFGFGRKEVEIFDTKEEVENSNLL